jgi:hypothetical protein
MQLRFRSYNVLAAVTTLLGRFHVTSTDPSRSNLGSKPLEVKLAPHTQRGSSGPHFSDTSSQSSHVLWPDDEAAQQTGPSEP